jgi:hypothetical protein
VSDFCPPPDLWDDPELEEPRYPHRPVEPTDGRAGEPEHHVRSVRRTLDPQTDLDRLVRRWVLIATGWLAVAAIAGLQGVDLTAGVIVCLILFVVDVIRRGFV